MELIDTWNINRYICKVLHKARIITLTCLLSNTVRYSITLLLIFNHLSHVQLCGFGISLVLPSFGIFFLLCLYMIHARKKNFNFKTYNSDNFAYSQFPISINTFIYESFVFDFVFKTTYGYSD